jgi:acid phosphatase family membrane protein YuiD
MEFLADIWANHTLTIPLSVAVAVQLFKFIWESVRRQALIWPVLMRTGGMPSSHSAMVTSLATATGLTYGFASGLFAVATVLAIIVMYDARGVRQESGQHARVLNQIVREMFSGQPITDRELKELLGHTSTEVFVGALVGILYTIFVVNLFDLGGQG